MKITLVLFVAITLLNNYCTSNVLLKCEGKDQYSDPCGSCVPRCLEGQLVQDNVCRGGCVCPKYYILDENDKCIPLRKCKGVPKCVLNEEYMACGPSCAKFCKAGVIVLPKCVACCTPGCFCKNGYIKNEDGVCIRERDCIPPQPTTTPIPPPTPPPVTKA